MDLVDLESGPDFDWFSEEPIDQEDRTLEQHALWVSKLVEDEDIIERGSHGDPDSVFVLDEISYD